MQVQEIMTPGPACCTPDESLQKVARKMLENDCGEIPVVESLENPRPVGVITDRDITCRAVARGQNPLKLKASDAMSSPAVTVTPETSLEDCCKVMEDRKIRRVPVVDNSGSCCGIVSQADIARHAPDHDTAEVVRDISEPPAQSTRPARR
jgi:CBS domain-containing protein